MLKVQIRIVFVSVLGLACGDGEDACSADQSICDCTCFEKVEPDASSGLTDHVVRHCDDTPRCPDFVLTCGLEFEGQVTPCPEVDSVAALDCALDMLAGGEPGRLSWKSNVGLSRYTTLHLVGDGTAFRNERDVWDTYGTWHDIALLRLQDRAHFEACAGAATVEGRTACLRTLFVGPAEEVCVPEFGYNSLYLPD